MWNQFINSVKSLDKGLLVRLDCVSILLLIENLRLKLWWKLKLKNKRYILSFCKMSYRYLVTSLTQTSFVLLTSWKMIRTTMSSLSSWEAANSSEDWRSWKVSPRVKRLTSFIKLCLAWITCIYSPLRIAISSLRIFFSFLMSWITLILRLLILDSPSSLIKRMA